MPLDPYEPAVTIVASFELDGFDRAVVGPAGLDETRSKAIDRLVVERRAHGPGRAHRVGDERARLQVDLVHHTVAMLVTAFDVREVLDQRAAQRDVQHLHAAADREGRRAVAHRGACEGDVERVDVVLHAVGVGVRGLAVAHRVDVGTADQHEPVEPEDDLVGLVVGDRHLEECGFLASRA